MDHDLNGKATKNTLKELPVNCFTASHNIFSPGYAASIRKIDELPRRTVKLLADRAQLDNPPFHIQREQLSCYISSWLDVIWETMILVRAEEAAFRHTGNSHIRHMAIEMLLAEWLRAHLILNL